MTNGGREAPAADGGYRAAPAAATRLPLAGGDGRGRWFLSRPRSAWLALLLALTQAILLAHVAWDKSDTADEGTHLAAAARLWASGDFRYNCEAPVLPKWGFALALRIADPSLSNAPARWRLWDRPAPEMRRILFAARLATILVIAGGGLLLWSAARRFGAWPAFLTHALWSFSPTVLANGSLATLDGWSAALMCGVIWAGVRMVERPGAIRAGVLGAFCAGAVASKVTTLGVLPVALAVMAWAWRRRGAPAAPTGAPLTTSLLAFFGTLIVVLWALYGFTVGGVDMARPCRHGPEGSPTAVGPVPFPAWLEGILFQWRHGAAGHPSYLFGEVRSTGWWWFYLACLALKVTVGAQALAVVRAGATVVRPPPRSAFWIDVALLAYPLLLLVAMSAGRHQANVMFLLPAFPFAMMWVGRGVADVHRAFGAAGRVLVVGFLLLGVLESLRVHPHYLMFFNVWAGGPTGGPRYLIHREDWGQDVRRLAEWQRREGIARVFYARYLTRADRWGVVYEGVPCEPRAGVYALHAVEVHRNYSLKRGCVDWLTVEPPDERIGYSIYIYRVDEERMARLQAERGTPTPFWRSTAHGPER